MIKYFEEKDIGTVNALKAWAECDNHHLDTKISEIENIGGLYRCLKLTPPELDYYIVREYIIWDKVAQKAWVIYDDKGPVNSYTEEAHLLSKFARNQWRKLIAKRQYEEITN